MSVCVDSWRRISRFTSVCKVHNVSFPCDERCPFSNSPPLVADGKAVLKKDSVFFEQGVEQGVTTIDKKKMSPNIDKSIFDSLVRSHAFRFVVSLGSKGDWEKILKNNGFGAVRKAGIGNVWMSSCFGFKCWFSDRSLTVYFPKIKEYFVDEARFGFNFALADLKSLLEKLEDKLSFSFKIENEYRFKVSGQHHALIHNSLAKMYNRDKEKLNVVDKFGELWLIIDNSSSEGFKLNELETIHKDTAIEDNDLVRQDFNELRDLKLTRGFLADSLNKLVEDRKFWAEHQRSHVASIQKLGEAVDVLSNKVSELNLKNSSREDFEPPTSKISPEKLLRARKILERWGW